MAKLLVHYKLFVQFQNSICATTTFYWLYWWWALIF